MLERKSREKPRHSFEEIPIERLDIEGASVEVADVMPTSPSEKPPVLLAPGWASTIPVYRPALQTLSQHGRRALTLNHPRIGNLAEFSDEQMSQLKDFSAEESRNAANLLKVLDAKRLGPVDAIGHSEGCINLVAAALVHPERFKNIVLFGPPGFIGEDSKLRLAKGWSQFMFAGVKGLPSLKEIPVTEDDKSAAKEAGREAVEYPAIAATETSKYVGAKALTEGFKYGIKNLDRAAKEALGMSSVDLIDAIREIRKKGVRVVIMSGVDDTIFPTEKMASLFKKGQIDGFLSVRGGHGQIGETPERYVVAAEQMLTAMEAKNKKQD